jgi:NSS family neurotransmitter:Na+ symporter
MVLTVVAGFLVTSLGLRKGVEKITKIMMLLLFALMVALAVHAMTLPGAAEGLRFYLLPDFGRLLSSGLGEVFFAAMGQAFFTLSIGIGTMTVFGSYIGRERSLTGESLRIIGMDSFVALASGFIIFPACFSYGINPGAGPGLLFVTLPNVFARMTGGHFWGAVFFLFMSFAALSTVIAVFENIVSYWIDVWGWGRRRASWINGVAMVLLSLPCVLGFNVLSAFQPLGPGSSVLDLEDFIVSAPLLPLGALVFILFTTSRYGWGWKPFLAEANAGVGTSFPRWSRLYVEWILPLVILLIFLKGYWDTFFRTGP